MPMRLECRSLVCRMVKVFFPSAAAERTPGRRIVAPAAAEPARNSRRESVSRDMRVKGSFPTAWRGRRSFSTVCLDGPKVYFELGSFIF